jgi:antitoxin ParD1/3/4
VRNVDGSILVILLSPFDEAGAERSRSAQDDEETNIALTQNICNSKTIGVNLHHIMTRQSISLTNPNDEWLKNQVESKEYSSKSEVVNDMIRQARQQQAKVYWLQDKLKKAEKSGFTSDSKSEILKQAKSR